MKLTILGNNGPYPSAGGACSGYLLTEGSRNILIDCGNGVLGNLQRFIRLEDLDAVILTHLHSDHMSDMMVLRYAVQIKRKRGEWNSSLSVYAPPEPAAEYQRLDVKDAFDLKPLAGDLVLNFENIRITFCEMKHPVLTFAVSLESGGKRFVFSGDTAWTQSIIDFSKDADLLMLDSGLLERDKTANAAHLSAEECGIVAREANAKRLLLTHFWPDYTIEELMKEARGNFENVAAALLLHEYII